MVKGFFDKVAGGVGRGKSNPKDRANSGGDSMRILKKGHAMRVIFFYPGEEGTYVDNADLTLYENGIVHIKSPQEETTTHLQNCEILWRFEVDAEDRANKLRLLKPKGEQRTDEGPNDSNPDKPTNKGGPNRNPELR